MVRRFFVLSLLIASMLCPLTTFAGSAFTEGVIDDNLAFEGFNVGRDGFVTGYIVNTSRVVQRGIVLDMWTTNPQETKIFWRKQISVGDLAPGQKYLVKAAYEVEVDDPARLKFMFRFPTPANFRNK